MKKTFGTMMLVAALAAGLYSCSSLSGAGSSVSSGSGAQPYTGNGGKGQSIAVLVPEGRGLSAEEAYLPTLVQGVFVGDFSKYSAMSILDRQNLEKVLRETESGIYEAGADFIELGKITKTGYALSGSVTKTQTAYTFSIAVTDTQSGQTKAAYNGSCTIAEFDNFSGIRKASAELLAQMGVQLTDAAKTELSGAAAVQDMKAQTALAQGITAQKRGTEVESLMYYNMAAAFDPSLLEAQNRVSVTAASISSGNIGEDARNDIKWRNDWIARLTEFEQFLDNYLKTNPPQYEFLYSTALDYGQVDYQKETLDMNLYARLIFADFGYFEALGKTIETVRQGLLATGRARDWDMDWWPYYINETRGGTPKPFYRSNRTMSGLLFQTDFRNTFQITVDILNNQGKVIGSAKQNVVGIYNLWGEIPKNSVNFFIHAIGNIQINAGCENPSWYSSRGMNSVYEYAVNANDITDTLTVRVTSINGARPASVKNLTITEYKDKVGSSFSLVNNSGNTVTNYFFDDDSAKIVFDSSGKICVDGESVRIPSSVWGKTVTGVAGFYRLSPDDYRKFISFYEKNGKKPGVYSQRWNIWGTKTYWKYERE
jgi:predicted small secreted protein